ncbi:MAG: hypothetical protein WBJ76_04245 [Candidatus Hydrothermia bacterium]
MRTSFYFDGCIRNDYKCLFIIPNEPLLFSYSLYAMWNFYSYFGKGKHILCPANGKESFLAAIFKDGILLPAFKKTKALIKVLEQHPEINLVINLDVQNASSYNFKFGVPYFSISYTELDAAILNYKPTSKFVDRIFTGFAGTLGVPKVEFELPVSTDYKSKARDYINYIGHGEKNLLVVCDVPEKREALLKEYLVYLTKGRLTFIGSESLKLLEPNLILSLLAFSDVFICEDSIYTYPAQVLNIKTYLFPGSAHFLPQPTKRIFIDRGDFKKDLILLLPGAK